MKIIYILSIISLTLFSSCASSRSVEDCKKEAWYNIAVAEEVEIFIDTLSIKHVDAVAYAREKRVFISTTSKKLYVDKIRRKYEEMKKPEKASKWDDFSYCIYNCLYDCTNKRFKVLSVEDFDSKGNRIVKTITAKNKERWLNVGVETVGDYTFFYVCDYNN